MPFTYSVYAGTNSTSTIDVDVSQNEPITAAAGSGKCAKRTRACNLCMPGTHLSRKFITTGKLS